MSTVKLKAILTPIPAKKKMTMRQNPLYVWECMFVSVYTRRERKRMGGSGHEKRWHQI